jgi:hypothetical protein
MPCPTLVKDTIGLVGSWPGAGTIEFRLQTLWGLSLV